MTIQLASQSGAPIVFGPRPLHGLWFAPLEGVRARVLLLTPLFEEKRSAHWAMVTCGRALVKAGAQVLIPDLAGTGNSEGELSEITLDDWLADISEAVALLRAHGNGPLRIISCRAGALLAAQAIAGGLAVDRWLLWQPITQGRSYLEQLRTRRVIQATITGGAAPPIGPDEIEGQRVSHSLLAALQELRLPVEPPNFDLSLVQCSFSEKLSAEYERLRTNWNTVPFQIRRLVTEPFWNPHSPGEYSGLSAVLTEETLA